MSSMSLWTPYVDDVVLDLSKRQMKREPITPPLLPQPAPNDFLPRVPAYPYYQHPYLPYPQAQTSPASRSSSSYEEYSTRATLSPPDSLTEAKAYKDSLSDDPDFKAFERDAMRAMAEKNGGKLLGDNPRMRRTVKSTNQNSSDDTYKTQRQRNNFAAKQSRDRRKMREIHLALKATYLENEVARLKQKLAQRYCPSCQHPCLY